MILVRNEIAQISNPTVVETGYNNISQNFADCFIGRCGNHARQKVHDKWITRRFENFKKRSNFNTIF